LTFSCFFLNAQTTSDNNPNFTLTTEGTCICTTAANGTSGTFFTGIPNEITYIKSTRAELDVLIDANVSEPDIALTITNGITGMFGLILNTQFKQEFSSWDVYNISLFRSRYTLATT
jgi:hypothetical protein